MNEMQQRQPAEPRTEKLIYFPRSDGSRIPYNVYNSRELYDLEQERIFRGPVWNFIALEAEIRRAGTAACRPQRVQLGRL
jgi:anthranilate 1,2-dioxygenase large subunit